MLILHIKVCARQMQPLSGFRRPGRLDIGLKGQTSTSTTTIIVWREESEFLWNEEKRLAFCEVKRRVSMCLWCYFELRHTEPVRNSVSTVISRTGQKRREENWCCLVVANGWRQIRLFAVTSKKKEEKIKILWRYHIFSLLLGKISNLW